MTVTIDEIKKKCSEERFFAYDSLQDRLFVPVAMYLVWLFVRIGVSGNAVSWLSAFVAVLGAFLLTSSDSLVVLIGSFGYILWCLFDYVDGAVARFNGKGSVAGQYIDWIMHVIVHVATIAGISIGAMNNVGPWIYPFVILGIVAASLAYAKFSMAWFAVCMEQQQRRARGLDAYIDEKPKTTPASGWLWFEYVRRLTVIVFHENYLIFTLPLMAVVQFSEVLAFIDLRVVFTVLAGGLYFPVQVLEIHRLVVTKRIQRGYSELFSPDHMPDLPNDHFLK